MNTSYLRLELKRIIGLPRFWIFSLSVPVLLFVLENSAYRGSTIPGTNLTYSAYLMCSLAAWGCIHATMISGSRIAGERSTGWQRQLRLTPLTPSQYLLAKVGVAMLITLPSPIIMALLGVAFDVRLSTSGWVQVIVGVWLAALPFAVMSTLLGQLATAESITAYFGAALLLLGFVGGILIPSTSFPDWLQDISKVMPSHWLAEIGHGALFGNSQLGTAIVILAAWTVVFSAGVLYRYQRDSAR